MPRLRKTKEEYVVRSKKVHKNLYDYSLFDYQGYKTKGKIACKKHGIFEQSFDNHVRGKGCPKCGIVKNVKSRSKSNAKFIKDAKLVHGLLYDYSDVEYVNWNTKVKIKCFKHGVYKQTPNNHSRGRGCPKCKSFTSKGEKELFKFVSSLTKGGVISNDRTKIKPKEIDAYIPSLNIGFEYNGTYWHSEKFKDVNHREHKTQEAKKVGVSLYHIEENDWVNNKTVMKKEIKNIINTHKLIKDAK